MAVLLRTSVCVCVCVCVCGARVCVTPHVHRYCNRYMYIVRISARIFFQEKRLNKYSKINSLLKLTTAHGKILEG